MAAIVHIVHCIDTEGPLFESLDAKFERIRELYAIDDIDVSYENLEKLRNKEIPLNGKEDDLAELLASHRTNTLGTWDSIDRMLDHVMSNEFRDTMLDENGHGWQYNWFCLDHIDFVVNPRKRDIGYHNVFDFYVEKLNRTAACERDIVQWHFHPMSTYNDAHRCATHYLRTDHIYQILCRKIIERDFFPTTYRAGFQAERPDSHWFLEQYIPFDYTNMAMSDPAEFDKPIDFRNGRSGDWRRAPSDWSVYQPDHDDYQVPGNCRRWIARCLNVLNRIASIDQIEMDKAFDRASKGKTTIVGLCSHDFRDLAPEVDHVRALISRSKAKFPDVNFRFSNSIEAFQDCLNLSTDAPLKLKMSFEPETSEDVPFIKVSTTSGTVFGPQPFLAIRTKSGRFIHDNLDFGLNKGEWYYAFHGDTLPLSDVDTIAVGANCANGSSCVEKMTF